MCLCIEARALLPRDAVRRGQAVFYKVGSQFISLLVERLTYGVESTSAPLNALITERQKYSGLRLD